MALLGYARVKAYNLFIPVYDTKTDAGVTVQTSMLKDLGKMSPLWEYQYGGIYFGTREEINQAFGDCAFEPVEGQNVLGGLAICKDSYNGTLDIAGYLHDYDFASSKAYSVTGLLFNNYKVLPESVTVNISKYSDTFPYARVNGSIVEGSTGGQFYGKIPITSIGSYIKLYDSPLAPINFYRSYPEGDISLARGESTKLEFTLEFDDGSSMIFDNVTFENLFPDDQATIADGVLTISDDADVSHINAVVVPNIVDDVDLSIDLSVTITNPNKSYSFDPVSMTLGWLVGHRIAGQRKKQT